ncbi:vitamin K epoxide reductase family protein [Glycomyces sp. NPDC047010]|uniref:vitamin K epoxide reductase family protein n=1 Tax=Glycomyces sp. NPDC047010 TaxID=3155023 RepID=UPI0033FBF1B0
MAAAGAVGAAAAFVLTVEKLALAADPGYTPTCSVNPVLSCGSVMSSAQAEAFGFPNPLIGLAGFPLLAGLGLLAATGTALPRWTWLGVQAGVAFAVVFVHWLVFQSLYRIGALCPYCMAVWAAVIPAFWYVTLHNLQDGRLPSPRSWRRGIDAAARLHTAVLALWFAAIAALVTQAFWDQWTRMLA